MGYRVGVDIGGSFTDFAVLNESDHSIKTLKVLSRPDEPGAEVIAGLQRLAKDHGISPLEVSYFTHGTTVGINTVIQRKGERLALLTTRNFEDVLELARLKIVPIHNLYGRRPDPLIPRDRVFPIDERIDRDGRVVTPVDRASVEQALEGIRRTGCAGVVVALLHAYRNGDNEQQVKAILQELAPELSVFCSSEIWPIIREYERTTTAIVSGYVQTKVAHYLTSLEAALLEMGVSAPPRITKSNGGVMSAAQAKADCVQMILSGTASGVIGAGFIAEHCNYPHILSLDIGGTSADVAVILNGQPQYGAGEVVGDFQIHIPSVSVTSVGQGGGSVAWLDGQGVLKVGPESAGSNPGPACYAKGGERATVTDAFAACGFIGHSELGYSAIQVDVDLSRDAIGKLATPLGLGVRETAQSIIDIAVSGMYADVSALVSRFGIDPRQFYFLAFGGAGPMLASFLAREVNARGVIVPLTPGVLSALGGLIADVKSDFISTIYSEVDPQVFEVLREAYGSLHSQALTWLRDEQGFTGDYVLTCSADMRYRGQSFEIETPLQIEWIEQGNLAALLHSFHEQHERLFGHSDAGADVQIINLRLVIAGATPKPQLARLAQAEAPPAVQGTVEVYVDGALRQLPVYLRKTLLAGHRLEGPLIVVQDDCTTCVLPDMSLEVDAYGNLVITAHSMKED